MVLEQDLAGIAALPLPWAQLAGRTVLVTGAGGLLGSLAAAALEAADAVHGLGLRVVPVVRRHPNPAPPYRTQPLLIRDIREPFTVDGPVDYILHCAAVTDSKAMVERPVEVIDVAVNGTLNALRLAAEKQTKGVVYLSSMEVYGATGPALERAAEMDLGALDLEDPRSCYPESKRLCEALCTAFFTQYGVPVRVARPAQVFGAGADLAHSTKVYAQFARSALSGEDIVLHTDGTSRGNYCYTADAVSALLTLLLCGEPGQAYNIANEALSMTVGEMAAFVARTLGKGVVQVVYDIPQSNIHGYAASSNLRLSAEKLRGLGWAPRYDMEDMYRRMAAHSEEAR